MSEARHSARLGLLLGTIGIAFAVSGLTLWFTLSRPETTEINQMVLGIVVHVLFGYIVVMSGIVVYRSELSASECMLVAKRCGIGAMLMGLLAIWAAIPELRTGLITLRFINELVIVSSVGAAAGVLIGLNRSQARRNRRLVTEKEDREETLVFLLQLLDHDIQNHLTAISGYVDMIDPSLIDSRADPVGGIRTRMDDIEQLLDTANAVLESETDQNQFEHIEISSILREQLELLQRRTPCVDIETTLEDELYIEANQFIDEVFYNLFDNTVVHNTPTDLTLSVFAGTVSDEIVVEIRDDGDGIPDHLQDCIFDPGVRTEESSGDGLGLYLVRKLIESYGGRIEITSGPATGTCFQLRFPKRAAHTRSESIEQLDQTVPETTGNSESRSVS